MLRAVRSACHAACMLLGLTGGSVEGGGDGVFQGRGTPVHSTRTRARESSRSLQGYTVIPFHNKGYEQSIGVRINGNKAYE